MQEPEFGFITYHTDLTVGDYIAFYASTDVVDGITITYSVETMNDDGTVTFYDDFRERFVTCTVEEFFAGGITGDYVVRGTSLVDQSYGPRLCEVRGYDTDAGYIYTYVGVDDGICYAFKLSDSDGNDACSATLAYSNMICGDLGVVGRMNSPRGTVRLYSPYTATRRAEWTTTSWSTRSSRSSTASSPEASSWMAPTAHRS